MSKKEKFIQLVQNLMENVSIDKDEWADALDYWNALQVTSDAEKPAITEKGIAILNFAKQNKELYNNLFKAKDIGDGLTLSSRAVSGSLRKLVTDGYFEKIGENPIMYSLTTKGSEAQFDI